MNPRDDKRGSLMFDIGYELQQLNCGAPVDRPRIARLIERIKEGETAVSHVAQKPEVQHCEKCGLRWPRLCEHGLCPMKEPSIKFAPGTQIVGTEITALSTTRHSTLCQELRGAADAWPEGSEIRRVCLAAASALSATRRSDEPVWVWGLTQEGIRDEVAQFAALMERKLKANDHKDHWSGVPMGYLLRRLREEIEELELAVKAGKDAELIGGEAADVGNFAMMIADNMSSLPQLPALPKNRADGGKQT